MLVRFDVDQSLQDRSWGDGRDVAARQWRRAVVWGLFRRFTHSGVWCRSGSARGWGGVAGPTYNVDHDDVRCSQYS